MSIPLPPLPEPWDYCYEWDGPFGTRKFSTASYNGNRPDRSVPIYTADQLHAHAAAISAERDARIKVLEEQVRVLTKLVDASEGGVDVDGVNWFDLREAARAALGDKT